MKMNLYLIAFLAVQSVAGFSVSGPASMARQSALYMTTGETEAKEIKVGVIGCGRIGLVHLEAITKAPGVTPVIVSNPTVSKAENGTNDSSGSGVTCPCKSFAIIYHDFFLTPSFLT